MNNALHSCLQTKCGPCIILEGARCSGVLVVEGYHAFLCEAEVSVRQCSESNTSSPASIAREVLIGVVMTARCIRVGSFAGAHNHCGFFSVVCGGGVVGVDVLTRALTDFLRSESGTAPKEAHQQNNYLAHSCLVGYFHRRDGAYLVHCWLYGV
jgi:hypothetical protein